MPYIGYGGKQFQSSELAKASFPSTSTGGTKSSTYSLANMYSRMAAEAKASNLERQKAIEGIFDRIIGMYAPGGSFGESYKAEIEKQKVRDVSATAQRDISRGLYGIRPYEQEWESAVGAGARLKLEDLLTTRLSSALTAKAGFMERIEQPYPDYGPLMEAEAAKSQAAGMMGGGSSAGDWSFLEPVPTYGGSGGPSGDIAIAGGRAGSPAGNVETQLMEQGMSGAGVIAEKGTPTSGIDWASIASQYNQQVKQANPSWTGSYDAAYVQKLYEAGSPTVKKLVGG